MSTPTSLRAALATARGAVLRTSADPAKVASIATSAGWQVRQVDTATVADKPALMRVLASALDLPDWFGANWDALADSLGDLDAQPGTVVVWSGSGALDPALAATLKDVLSERADAEAAVAPLVVVRTTA